MGFPMSTVVVFERLARLAGDDISYLKVLICRAEPYSSDGREKQGTCTSTR